MKRFAAAALLLVPQLVLACPSCARDNGRFALVFIGSMISLPFAVVFLAKRAIGKLESESEAADPKTRGNDE